MWLLPWQPGELQQMREQLHEAERHVDAMISHLNAQTLHIRAKRDYRLTRQQYRQEYPYLAVRLFRFLVRFDTTPHAVAKVAAIIFFLPNLPLALTLLALAFALAGLLDLLGVGLGLLGKGRLKVRAWWAVRAREAVSKKERKLEAAKAERQRREELDRKKNQPPPPKKADLFRAAKEELDAELSDIALIADEDLRDLEEAKAQKRYRDRCTEIRKG